MDYPKKSSEERAFLHGASDFATMTGRRFLADGMTQNANTGVSGVHDTLQPYNGRMSIEQVLGQALQLHRAGRLAEAEGLYRQVLAQQPQHPEALHLLGLVAQKTGRSELAADLMRRSISSKPQIAEFHVNLGVVLASQGRHDQAMAAFRQALALKPDSAEAHYNLGLALGELQRWEESLAAFGRAVAGKPGLAEAHHRMGRILLKMDRYEEAAAAFRLALTLKPDDANSANGLGLALSAGRNSEEAVGFFRQAIAIDADFFAAYNNLGNTLNLLNRHEEAIEVFQRAMGINPKVAAVHNGLALALMNIGRLDEGLETLRRAVDLDPGESEIHGNMVYSMQYLHGGEGAVTLAEARGWDSRHAEPLRKAIAPYANSRDPQRRLRIGYVSADFREHSVSRFLEPLFQNQDHGNFEIVCYSDVRNADSTTALLRECADQWHEIASVRDESLAEMIRGQGIDILVDLMGFTARNRLLVFARKPAPIQISYLGYPGTTGLATMDYRLTDGVADPPGTTEDFYTEKLLRLPRTNWCYAPPAEAPEVAPPPFTQGHPFCFASFNKFTKATAKTLDLWAEILKIVSGSRLLLKDRALSDRLTRQRTRQEFERRGIDAERLDLAGFEDDLAAHLRKYAQVDVALDTFPYHGTTTTCEALWMGVPVVTLAGVTHVARVGASLLTSVGLGELIAARPEEYIAIAARLAGNESRLRELRGTLRQRMGKSPLMDGPGFAREVEAAYREVWRRRCAGAST